MNDPGKYGKYTGAKDVRGAKLFVGDIVEYTEDHKVNIIYGNEVPADVYELGEVVFDYSETRYCVKVWIQRESRYGGKIPYYKVLQFYSWRKVGNIETDTAMFVDCEVGEIQIDGSVKKCVN